MTPQAARAAQTAQAMAKRLDSTYSPGKRTPNWRKIKHRRRVEVVIGGFTEPILVLVAIVAAAVLYPALKAALIRPVDAMRHH